VKLRIDGSWVWNHVIILLSTMYWRNKITIKFARWQRHAVRHGARFATSSTTYRLISWSMFMLSARCDWLVVVIVTRIRNGRSRLVIDSAMKRDDGTYMCVAENPAGMRRAIAAVRVKGQISLATFDFTRSEVIKVKGQQWLFLKAGSSGYLQLKVRSQILKSS